MWSRCHSPDGQQIVTGPGADESDLSLVRRVQRGDKGAFDLLVLKYQHKVIKLVMRYVRSPAEAEDIAQDVPGCGEVGRFGDRGCPLAGHCRSLEHVCGRGQGRPRAKGAGAGVGPSG